jgi:glycyl-tRNA synthetase beta subunit
MCKLLEFGILQLAIDPNLFQCQEEREFIDMCIYTAFYLISVGDSPSANLHALCDVTPFANAFMDSCRVNHDTPAIKENREKIINFANFTFSLLNIDFFKIIKNKTPTTLGGPA